MIADTTFLVHYVDEYRNGVAGPAQSFFARNRTEIIRTSIISIGEIAVSFDANADAWSFFKRWTIYRLHPGIVDAAADLDRELIASGGRLGENDNWIAGFCRYYREPVISLDQAFDRVPRLRRLAY